MSRNKPLFEDYDINKIGDQRFVDFVIKESGYLRSIKSIEDNLLLSPVKERYIKEQIRGIKEEFPERPFGLQKVTKGLDVIKVIEQKGYFSFINSPSVEVGRMVEGIYRIYKTDLIKAGKITHPKLNFENETFAKLSDKERFDFVVCLLFHGGMCAALKYYLENKLVEITRLKGVQEIASKSNKSEISLLDNIRNKIELNGLQIKNNFDNMDINVIGKKRFVDFILTNKHHEAMIQAVENDLSISQSKELYIKENLRGIKESYPERPFGLLKESKDMFANEIVKERGYRSFILYPWVSIKELADLSYEQDFLKSGNVNHSLSNQDFRKLTVSERFDKIVTWLLFGGSAAALESHFTKKLAEITRGEEVQKIKVKSKNLSNKNINSENETSTDIFISKEAYEIVMNQLKKENLIDETSCEWIENTKGWKSDVVALIYHLQSNKYFRSNKSLNPEQIQDFAMNTFNVSVSVRTIKGKKITSLRRKFPFITQFSPKN